MLLISLFAALARSLLPDGVVDGASSAPSSSSSSFLFSSSFLLLLLVSFLSSTSTSFSSSSSSSSSSSALFPLLLYTISIARSLAFSNVSLARIASKGQHSIAFSNSPKASFAARFCSFRRCSSDDKESSSSLLLCLLLSNSKPFLKCLSAFFASLFTFVLLWGRRRSNS